MPCKTSINFIKRLELFPRCGTTLSLHLSVTSFHDPFQSRKTHNVGLGIAS